MAPSPPSDPVACWIKVRDSTTGQPLRNHPIVAEVLGDRVRGTTDADGYAVVQTKDPLDVIIHIVFSAPRRELHFTNRM